jgi:hypothetical protein
MNRIQKTNGSAMITAVVLAAVLSILVAGYLSSISSQYTLDNRATQWQQSLYLAEAGVELGLEQMNYHYATGNSPFSGWQSLAGGTAYSTNVTGLLDLNGDTVGDYSVVVTNVGGTAPIVYATGTAANLHGPSVSRMVWVTTKKGYPYSFLSKGNIKSTNPSFYIDSFDSSTTTNGQYPGGGPLNANALMGTTAGGTISWTGNFYGNMTVSGAGTMTSLSGSMGNVFGAGRATTVGSAVAKGFLQTVPAPSSFPAATAPYSAGAPAKSLGAMNLSTTNYTLASGDYYATSITGTSAGGKLNCTGNVRLYVTGAITFNQNCGIDVASGGNLELYVGTTITLNNAGYINSSSSAGQCIITGLGASGTSWSLTCNGKFNAVVYAPNVDVTVTGTGVISGAMYANSFTMSGAGSFHYDEALGQQGIPYSTQAWKEYRNTGSAWVPN